MANENSVISYTQQTLQETAEGLGITRLTGANATEWNQLIGGLILQGGLSPEVSTDGSQVINFSVVFPKKCLGVFLQSIYTATGGGAGSNENTGMILTGSVDTEKFTILNDGQAKSFYWWAVGL